MDSVKQQHQMLQATELLIAYVYGETPPDFVAIAACGFTVVCLDTSASWFSDVAVANAKENGLTVVAFRMQYDG